jgi:hypothetical protein
MCDFHSIAVRRDGAIAHVHGNSHSGAVHHAGWRENQPNREPFFVEAEWNGNGEYPGAEKITRNHSKEFPLTVAQTKAIDRHYQALASVLIATHPTAEEIAKWNKPEFADVMERICAKIEKLPEIEGAKWHGNLYVRQGGTLTAPALTEITGYLYVRQGGTLTAPALTEITDNLDVQQGGTLTAPALTKTGNLDVQQGGTLTAPALTKTGNLYVQQGGTLTAPALTEITDNLYVQQGGTLTAPAFGYNGRVK